MYLLECNKYINRASVLKTSLKAFDLVKYAHC